MSPRNGSGRRQFLKSVALASSTVVDVRAAESGVKPATPHTASRTATLPEVAFPRTFSGPALSTISFPLGGIGAGSIGLGGRGQLRDWEIVNSPDKGKSPDYAFASIWVQPRGKEPIARVLEARLQPPYEGENGLGSQNAPGLSRLDGATFTGEFPLARIEFHDRALPVKVSLEAGTPFIPLDPDESGLPIAVLRYRVRNTGSSAADVAISFSLDNPVRPVHPKTKNAPDTRQNEIRHGGNLQGIFMRNPGLAKDDEGQGSFALAAIETGDGGVTMLRGWPAGRWWNSPLLFWDDFSHDGQLGPETDKPGAVGAVSIKRTVYPGAEAVYTFLLAWHFPNRTPERCGWTAPKGHENAVIGNWYCTRFADAWSAAEYAVEHLPELERRTKRFAEVFRASDLPSSVKEAASANLSTLVTQTCFRTADGEFHGFEGIDDHRGCCFGNCTHVWNYETATASLFPSLSVSLRRAALGFSMDERGAIYFRQTLPDGIERVGFAAADGQMGQVVKVYLDWQLSGSDSFLREFWPKAKKAMEFCWVPGGWDADRDGVMEGVQHNTYDVEFYGPNPLCGIYYLAALRASEEMARGAGDAQSAAEFRRLFENGSKWIDQHLFNGEYYHQEIRAARASDIAAGLRSGMGADDPEHPQYQVGDGCLIDQLLGQYIADVCGLGPLVDERKMRAALDAIHRYNHKPNLLEHDCVERTFALNDEAAMVICDYANAERPRIPFPYYAEVMTGFEHSTAALMLYRGMTDAGLRAISDIRRRYDGVRRNPWNEAECGNHYARAMAAWSSVLALSGFRYGGPEKHVAVLPRIKHNQFRCFWSAGEGWGAFVLGPSRLTLSAEEGHLNIRSIEMPAASAIAKPVVRLAGRTIEAGIENRRQTVIVRLHSDAKIVAGQPLVVSL